MPQSFLAVFKEPFATNSLLAASIFSNFAKRKLVMKLLLLVSILIVCNFFATAIAIEPDAEVLPASLIWINGELPGQFLAEGDWIWDGEATHNEASTHKNSTVKGIEAHGFRTDAIVGLNQESKVIQYVNLDVDNMPSGIMLKLFLSAGKEIILYWEGDEEAFVELDEYIAAWYMGFIPTPGIWTGLEIDCRGLDIKSAKLLGMEFITNNGIALWGETVIISSASGQPIMD